MPVPGYDVRIVTTRAARCAPGDTGNVAIRLPLPPGCLPTLWNNDAALTRRRTCAPIRGYYLTADAGFKDDDGYSGS